MARGGPQPPAAWLLQRQFIVNSLEAFLRFRRKAGPPPSARQAVADQRVEAWKQSDDRALELQKAREREEQTKAELAAAEQRFVTARDEGVPIASTSGTDADLVHAEQALVVAQATVAELTTILEVRRRRVRVAYYAALQSYTRMVASVTEADKNVASPNLESTLADFEKAISPWLDRVLEALRNYEDCGKGFPDPVEVIGPPPPTGLPQERPRRPGESVPIIADNRVPNDLRKVIAPAPQPALPDPCFPVGSSGKRFFDP